MIVKKKKKPASEILTLPTERSVPSHNLADFSILLYGLEKIGKTNFANQFPEPFFLETEAGTKAISVFGRPVRTWQDFLGYIDLLDKTSRFSTVVVDTVDYLYNFCEEYVCQKLCIDHMSEEAFSKGWDMLRMQFTMAINRITAGKRGIIFISHSEEKTVRRTGKDIDRIIPSMKKGCLKVIRPLCDIIAYFHYNDDGERILQIRGDECLAGGHRLTEHFQGIERIPMGDDPAIGYKNFVKAFNTVSNSKLKPPSTSSVSKGGEKKRVIIVKH